MLNRLGTHNAFLSVGDGSYLELFAPDPDATSPLRSLIGVDSVAPHLENKQPRLTTYCCNAGNVGIDELVSKLQEDEDFKQYYPSSAESGSRKNDIDGTVISWKVAVDKHDDVPYAELPMGGLVPFFIDWGDCATKRPGVTIAPTGCTLKKLTAYHPNPSKLQRVLENIGYDVDKVLTSIEEGPEPKLVLTLETPNGVIELS